VSVLYTLAFLQISICVTGLCKHTYNHCSEETGLIQGGMAVDYNLRSAVMLFGFLMLVLYYKLPQIHSDK
jgi:hypothetical protein